MHSPIRLTKLIIRLCIAGLMATPSIGTAAVENSPPNLLKQTTTAEHVVGPCRFRIANMFGGEFREAHPDSSPPQQGSYYLPITGPSSFLTGGFGLFCVEANEERITSSLNGKYVDGRWWTYGPVDGPEFVPYEEQAKARTIPLKEKNWTGITYTEDATTGDERTQARVFHFCLVRDARALCGYTVVEWLADRKGRNDLDRIKAILESVEFIDTPLPAGGSATSSVTKIEK